MDNGGRTRNGGISRRVGHRREAVLPSRREERGDPRAIAVARRGGGERRLLGDDRRAKLPLRLPIRIWGLNDKWTAGIYDRKQKRWNPFGIIAGEGVGYVSLDTSKADSDVFIGNLVQCDDPNLILTFLENGNGGTKVVAHNPTNREIDATVKATEGFDLIQGFSKTVKVPAGSSIEVRIND